MENIPNPLVDLQDVALMIYPAVTAAVLLVAAVMRVWPAVVGGLVLFGACSWMLMVSMGPNMPAWAFDFYSGVAAIFGAGIAAVLTAAFLWVVWVGLGGSDKLSSKPDEGVEP